MVSENKVQCPRLSDILFDEGNTAFSSIVCMPSNVEAIDGCLLFGAGLESFVAITSPSGWGKTHMLKIAANRVSHFTSSPVRVRRVQDFLANGARSMAGPVIIDDCHEAISRQRLRLDFLLAIERRVRSGRPTLLAFAEGRGIPKLTKVLPNSREWLMASIKVPAPQERTVLVHRLAAQSGLSLSNALVSILANELKGNCNTLLGALQILRISGVEWVQPKSTLRACGLLQPFLADNPGWDLCYRVRRLSEQSRALFPRVLSTDLAIVALLHEAELPESKVADAFEMGPGEVYLRASSFAREVQASPEIALYLDRFCELVVSQLAAE